MSEMDKVVFLDINSPYDGVDNPVGRQHTPVNNIDDAREIARRVGAVEIRNIGRPTLFEAVKRDIHSNNNCNFHWDALDWKTRVWFVKLCEHMDKRLVELEERIRNDC